MYPTHDAATAAAQAHAEDYADHSVTGWLKVKQPKYREGERGWEQRSR